MVKAGLLFSAFLFSMVAISAQALDVVPSRLVFTARVDFPTRLAVCAGHLWAYERKSGQLVKMSLHNGSVIKRRPLDALEPFRQVSAMACVEDQLLMAYDVSKNPVKSRLRLIPTDENFSLDPDDMPTVSIESRVQDVFCAERDCFVLSEGRLFTWHQVVPPGWKCSGDNCFYQSMIKMARAGRAVEPKLTEVKIPLLTTLRPMDITTSDNPFAEWGLQNSHATGLYVAGETNLQGTLLLVDPFLSTIVRRAPGKIGWWGRWGRWGFWEGRLMFPKDVALLKDGFVAVLDGVLRTISVFSDSGEYQGLVELGGQTPLLLWPADIVASGSTIYVSDSEANSITAIEVKTETGFKATVRDDSPVSVSLFRRQGFIADSDTDRCLHCHDGTLSDHARNFEVRSPGTHPIDVSVKRNVSLPLDQFDHVVCKTCHEPHHGDYFRSEKGAKERTKPFLRLPAPNLCMQCHDNRDRPHSHPMNAKVSCLNCHEVHGQIHGSLIRHSEQLCLECHKRQHIQHRPVDLVLETDRAQKLHFENHRVSCHTCHSPHQGDSAHLLKGKGFVLEFCSSCHGNRTENLYKNFHKLIQKRGVKWTP